MVLRFKQRPAGYELFVLVRLFMFGMISELWDVLLTTSVHCRLVREASIHAKQTGERNVSPRSVRKVREVCLESGFAGL
jgi:hypothetical protein